MLDIALAIEAQSGLTWPRWQRLVRTVEELGFAALYRTDHLINAQPPDEATLELWTSLTWLACHTERLEFGSLVCPLTFRHPVHLAQTAASLDELSNGRFTLGLGAGWSRREHDMYGFEMYAPAERLDRFDEGLRVITGLLRSETPVTFSGRYFRLHEAQLSPPPAQRGALRGTPDPRSPSPTRADRPRILVAGRGARRSLPLAAAYADDWNVMFVTPDELRDLNCTLDGLLNAAGRQPADLRRTVMQAVEIGRTEAEVAARREARAWAWWRTPGIVAGTPPQVRQVAQQFEQAGAHRLILQWLDLDDLDALHLLAEALL